MAPFHRVGVPELRLSGPRLRQRLKVLLGRQVWLPRTLYLAVPWIYLGSGITALVGALYLPDWAWTLPYLLLFGLTGLHAGIAIGKQRQCYIRAKFASDTPDCRSDA